MTAGPFIQKQITDICVSVGYESKNQAVMLADVVWMNLEAAVLKA